MGYVQYVGFTTCRRATVMTRSYFKKLMFMQMFCIKKNKNKKIKRVVTGFYPKWVWILWVLKLDLVHLF